MTEVQTNSTFQPALSAECSVRKLLQTLDEALRQSSSRINEQGYFLKIGDELRQLHAGLRIHHTAGFRRGSVDPTADTRPELVEVLGRLTAERPMILGNLDRLIRSSDSIGDQALEDRDVFVLRVKELVAMLRRHQAEEDWLFIMATWRETGGES